MRRRSRVFAFVSAPVDTRLLPPIPCSVGHNDIGVKGASALAAVLKKTKITHLKCAAAPSVCFRVSTSCTRSQTHTPLPHSHLRDAALLVCRVCTKATSSFRRASRACSRTHVTPLWPPCRSLEHNQLDEQAQQAMQAIKDAAGSGIEIQFDSEDENPSED